MVERIVGTVNGERIAMVSTFPEDLRIFLHILFFCHRNSGLQGPRSCPRGYKEAFLFPCI